MSEGVPEVPPHYDDALALAKRSPRPARCANVLTGTAGWTDPTLIKSHAFYPRGTSKPEARLKYYAEEFPLVEVDATYYSILDPSVAVRWVAWTGADFVFNIKAHASMTGHPLDLTRLPRELRAQALELSSGTPRLRAGEAPPELVGRLEEGFANFLQPLLDANRLGIVLFQFPPWFEATQGNARQLAGLRERWPELPIAIEFRHGSWLEPGRRERVASLLAEHSYSYVAVDEPFSESRGVPPERMVSNPRLALVRMHGRNTAAWRRRGTTVLERFNYLYSPTELASWLAPVRQLADEAEQVHVVFNNCVRDFAVVNARGFASLLNGVEA